jgi:hypothetical protein
MQFQSGIKKTATKKPHDFLLHLIFKKSSNTFLGATFLKGILSGGIIFHGISW